MDNQKKEKIVALILTTLVSLAVSIVGCILGISPDALNQPADGTDTSAVSSVSCVYDE